MIRSDIRTDTRSIEVFVALPDNKALTGLLAELEHNLKKKMQEETSQPVQQITNVIIKDNVIQRSNLLFGKGQGFTVILDSVIQRSVVV